MTYIITYFYYIQMLYFLCYYHSDIQTFCSYFPTYSEDTALFLFIRFIFAHSPEMSWDWYEMSMLSDPNRSLPFFGENPVAFNSWFLFAPFTEHSTAYIMIPFSLKMASMEKGKCYMHCYAILEFATATLANQ